LLLCLCVSASVSLIFVPEGFFCGGLCEHVLCSVYVSQNICVMCLCIMFM
jgi:hypothetical protein